jgi:hypothetical protein
MGFFFPMPKINLETYEFCLQLFKTQENISKWLSVEAFSDEILNKYFKVIGN